MTILPLYFLTGHRENLVKLFGYCDYFASFHGKSQCPIKAVESVLFWFACRNMSRCGNASSSFAPSFYLGLLRGILTIWYKFHILSECHSRQPSSLVVSSGTWTRHGKSHLTFEAMGKYITRTRTWQTWESWDMYVNLTLNKLLLGWIEGWFMKPNHQNFTSNVEDFTPFTPAFDLPALKTYEKQLLCLKSLVELCSR